MIGSSLFRRVGNERALMRPDFANDTHEVRKRIPFDIEFQFRMFRQQVGKRIHVGRTDVPLIRPRWTVMPSAPAPMTISAARITSGMPMLRVFRSRAMRFRLTLNLVTLFSSVFQRSPHPHFNHLAAPRKVKVRVVEWTRFQPRGLSGFANRVLVEFVSD